MKELYRLSPYNRQTLDLSHAPKRVMINDCTLREGEQSSESAFSLADKERMASLLEAVGVGQVQIGFPPKDAAERKEMARFIRCLQRARSEVMVVAFSPNWREQIDWAVEMEPGVVHIIYRASPYLLKLLGSSEAQLLERTAESISYARSRGAREVAFCPTDTTRAEWSTLQQVFRTARDAGANTVAIADTVGVCTPSAIRWLVSQVRQLCGLPVEIHTHNDFGLALANTLAGIEAGASVVDTCVNGMGDRNGNPSLDEVAVALKLLNGIETGIDLARLSEVSAFVAGVAGQTVPPNKPVVGLNAFSHKLDIHVRAAVADPLAFQAYLPELVGNRRRIVIGKLTGPYAVRAKLQELGEPDPGDAAVNRLVDEVNHVASEHRRALSDEEFAALAKQVAAAAKEAF